MLRSLLDAYLRHRFAWLLGLLIAAVGVEPVLGTLGLEARALEGMLAFALVAAVAGVWRSGRSRLLVRGSAVALLGWLALNAVALGGGPALTPAALGAWSLWLAGGVLGLVLAAGRVNAERICAALCVYMLVGLAFGGFFATLEGLDPGSLVGGGPTGVLAINEATYFSFVTLATLGYGDVVPGTGPARALAVLEAVFGQLYLVVLVARLVSLYGKEN